MKKKPELHTQKHETSSDWTSILHCGEDDQRRESREGGRKVGADWRYRKSEHEPLYPQGSVGPRVKAALCRASELWAIA